MEQRFTVLMGKALPVVFGTFHSVFYRMLQEEYRLGADAFLSEKAKYQLLKEAAAVCHLQTDQRDFFPILSRELSYMKNMQIRSKEYRCESFPSVDLGRIYAAYEMLKETYQMLDFDDMLTKTLEMLQKNPAILKKWQERFSFFLLDEAQDMNPLQFHIIRLLAQPENHLFLVGDDDQSIYAFRGADPGLLMKFPQYYPGCAKIFLENNYRSASGIVHAAGCLISRNRVRCEKQMRSVKTEAGVLEQVCYENGREEAEGIVKKIKNLRVEGREWEDMAVLCRQHVQLQELLQLLLRESIPFYFKDYMKNPWKHWAVSDLLAYLKLAKTVDGKMERSLVLSVMNRPSRYLSRASLGAEDITFEEWKRFYRGKDWIQKRLDVLEKQLFRLRKLSGFAAVHMIRTEMGYDAFLREYISMHPGEREAEEALDQLQDLSRGMVNIQELIAETEALAARIDEKNSRKRIKDGVGLYTIHGAKGLEFPVVFLPGCNEGDCPSKNAKTVAGIEEERRIFYVALTRAKEQLYLSCVKEDARGRRFPSRFLDELKPMSHQRSLNSASSNSSSNRSSTSSYSSSERIFSKEGSPFSFSK